MADYLAKYKPELPNLLKDFAINEDVPEAERAFKANELLRIAKRNNECLFLVIGMILKTIRDEELYLKLDYESFSQYLASEEVSYSRESAYLFIRSYEYLIQHLKLNPDEVGKMNIGRINNMIPVLKKVEEEQGMEQAIEMIKDFQALRHGDFVQKIQESRKTSKPDVYFTEEDKMWHVNYWEDTTVIRSKGLLSTYEETEKTSQT
jgi:hypothetical protein